MRVSNDFYPTPVRLLDSLFSNVPLDLEDIVFEPTAGDLRISQVIPNCLTNELYPKEGYPTDFSLDATKDELYSKLTFDWAIGNPPFKQAFPIVKKTYQHCRKGVAFLLRLSFDEPTQERYDWLQSTSNRLSHQIIFSGPRPSFREGEKGTDSVTTAWFVWQKKHSQGTRKVYIRNWNN
jgi:hypothetical protein